VSGLLRRLAARAIGVAPTVRPIVGWATPAAQPSFGDAFSASEPGETQAPASPLPPTESPASRNAQRVGAAALLPRGPDTLAHSARAAPPAAAQQHDVDEVSHQDLPQRPTETVASAPNAAPRTEVRIPAPLAPRLATAGRAEAADRAPAEPHSPGRLTEARVPAPERIPPLLPHRPLAPLFQQRASEAPLPGPATAARPTVEETTEVHVSIGRIELTAVHEAPPKRREPERARKPRSLEDYLAARQERAR
jgi:hypothetical protein